MKKYKVGVVTGKFMPPHIGHAELIERAHGFCDVLYVVLAERFSDECSESKWLKGGETRLGWMKEYWKDNKSIKFLYMNHGDLPPRPHGTEQWCQRLKDLIGVKIDARFFGCEDYLQMNEFFLDCDSVLIRRGVDSVDISATKIRENPEEYSKYIIATVKNVDY